MPTQATDLKSTTAISASTHVPLTPDTLLTSAELAIVLKIASRTPEAWRIRGHGPRYSRIGGKLGRVVYRWSDVQEYLNSRAFTSTSQESALAA